MKRLPLTYRETQILGFIRMFVKKNGYSPTYQEIASGFGMTKAGAFYFVKNLQKKGYIRIKKPRSWRKITLTKN